MFFNQRKLIRERAASENENRSIDRRRRVSPRDRYAFSRLGGGRRFAFNRAFSTSTSDVKSIKSTRSTETNRSQSNNPTQSNPIQFTPGSRRSPPARDPTDRPSVTAPPPYRRARSIARTRPRRRARRENRRASRRDPRNARARMRSRASPATSRAPSRGRARSSKTLSSGVAPARPRRRVGVVAARVDLPRASIARARRKALLLHTRVFGKIYCARDGDFERISGRRATDARARIKTPQTAISRDRAIGGGNTNSE